MLDDDKKDDDMKDDDMKDDDKKQAAHRALVDRVLRGKGKASAEQRARAFGNDGLSPPLDALVGMVAFEAGTGHRDGLRDGEGAGLQRGSAFRAGDMRCRWPVHPAV